MQVLELQPRGGGGGDDAGDAASPAAKLEGILEHVKRVMEISVDTDLGLSDEDKGNRPSSVFLSSRTSSSVLCSSFVCFRLFGAGPFQNVFLQECVRMNDLIKEITRSVRELELGLNGELTMSPLMEALQYALLFLRVPEQVSSRENHFDNLFGACSDAVSFVFATSGPSWPIRRCDHSARGWPISKIALRRSALCKHEVFVDCFRPGCS